MTVSSAAARVSLEARARQSLGASSDAIHGMVAAAIDRHDIKGAAGRSTSAAAMARCGVRCSIASRSTTAWTPFATAVSRGGRVHARRPRRRAWPVASAGGDLVAAVETIEHLENPWAFVRQLAALAAPGGWVIVTTPNQLSLLSVLTLVLKRRFSAFQDAHYPAHRTALLENDLRRIAEASGLEVVEVGYSLRGRIPLTGWHYPAAVARRWPRALSDNVMIVARKAACLTRLRACCS